MRRRELSAKIERYMERGEEEMRLSRAAAERSIDVHERNRVAFERNTLAFERVMAALDRHEQLIEELIAKTIEEMKLFIREMNRRSERVVQDLVKGNAEFSTEQRKRTDEIVAEMRDARQESRAHREAILAMLDRLPPAQAA